MKHASLVLLTAPLLAAQSQAVLAGLATGSYFPLDVGDRWVYRIDDRAVTASYQNWRIDRTDQQNGQSYSVMAIEGPGSLYAESWFRADAAGRVYLLTGNGELLFLDPTRQSNANPELQLDGTGGAVKTALGSFPDTVTYLNSMGSLVLETGTLARGVGLLSSISNLLSGSSGGFTEGRMLVEATVAGIRLPAPTAGIQLGIENLSLNVSGQQVTNCAVPCYFVACALAPGTDPPGTYKPCAQARVELTNWPAGLSRAVRLQLLDPGGSAAYDQTLTLDAAPQQSVLFVQLPLYSAPDQPLAPGTYQLSAYTADGGAQAALAVQIR